MPGDTKTAAEQPLDEIRTHFVESRGYWNRLLSLDPEFFAAYTELTGIPWRAGILEPRVKELIYLAMDVSVTRLYEPGLRHHIENDRRHGATSDQCLGTLELAVELGLQSLKLGVPILDELAGTSLESPSPEAEEIPAHYAETFGACDHSLDALLRRDPAFLRSWSYLTSPSRRSIHLDRRPCGLVGVALNASATHFNAAEVRRYMREALAAGATESEMMEVLELLSGLGIHAGIVGVPIPLEVRGGDDAS